MAVRQEEKKQVRIFSLAYLGKKDRCILPYGHGKKTRFSSFVYLTFCAFKVIIETAIKKRQKRKRSSA